MKKETDIAQWIIGLQFTVMEPHGRTLPASEDGARSQVARMLRYLFAKALSWFARIRKARLSAESGTQFKAASTLDQCQIKARLKLDQGLLKFD
jgi:hypothetical protein